MDHNQTDTFSERENALHRYMQLREELKNEVEQQLGEMKIQTTELGDATKRFIAHFDIFKALSDESAEKISKSIEASAQKMADRAADGFSKIVNDKVDYAVERLNESVRKASQELQYVIWSKTWRNLAIAGLSCILCLSVGFSAAYFFVPPQTVEISEAALETFNHGRLMEDAWPSLTNAEREKIMRLAKSGRH